MSVKVVIRLEGLKEKNHKSLEVPEFLVIYRRTYVLNKYKTKSKCAMDSKSISYILLIILMLFLLLPLHSR